MNRLPVSAQMNHLFGPHRGRTPRSHEYMDGCRAALELAGGEPRRSNPYAAGTAQADAWWAGYYEGFCEVQK